LLATMAYLALNGYTMIIPLSAVRFTVKIARNEKNDPNDTTTLIHKIAKWIKKLSAKDDDSRLIGAKALLYFVLPLVLVIPISVISFGKLGRWIVGRWMAFDMYPEYQKESRQILSFIVDSMKKSLAKDLLTRKP
ncbi:MAG: hypothetical protein KGI27_14465, partial [Thaumarchaeota archaeon]|nr:hypothetical protein [Nitrososphaerota archaeon]